MTVRYHAANGHLVPEYLELIENEVVVPTLAAAS